MDRSSAAWKFSSKRRNDGSETILLCVCGRQPIDYRFADTTMPCCMLAGRMKDIYIADLAGFDEGKTLRRLLSRSGQAAAHHQNEQALSEPDSGRQDRPARGARLGAGRPAHRQGLRRAATSSRRAAALPVSTTALQMKVDQLRKAQAGRGGQDGPAALHHLRCCRAVGAA